MSRIQLVNGTAQAADLRGFLGFVTVGGTYHAPLLGFPGRSFPSNNSGRMLSRGKPIPGYPPPDTDKVCLRGSPPVSTHTSSIHAALSRW